MHVNRREIRKILEGPLKTLPRTPYKKCYVFTLKQDDLVDLLNESQIATERREGSGTRKRLECKRL